MDLSGQDSYGGCYYIGTGCFHRRDALCGKKYCQETKLIDWKSSDTRFEESADVLEETCKVLASCHYEENSLWGKEVIQTLSLTHSYTVTQIDSSGIPY